MAPRYTRPLKVSHPDGTRVMAQVKRSGDQVRIVVEKLEEVKKDNPQFADDGIISITVPVSTYQNVLIKLTQYIEDLFLKGMADEDTYSSLGTKPKSRRAKKSDSKRETGSSEGEGSSSSVHTGPRRSESSEDSRRGQTDSEMAEGSDSEGGRKD